jgi:sulfonate dioxygenase
VQYKYRDYLPVYDETTNLPITELFGFADRGQLADKTKPYLLGLKDPNIKITKLTPRVGTEIIGLKLSELTDDQENELALLIAEGGWLFLEAKTLKISDSGSKRSSANISAVSMSM